MSHLRFESNVNYDLGKTALHGTNRSTAFESNVNYDLGKTNHLVPPLPSCLRAM